MKKINLAWVQWCWLAVSLTLFAGGLLTLATPEDDLVSIAFYLGCVMMLTGCINIVIYVHNEKTIHGSHWLLADGISTALLSLFLLVNQKIEPETIPFFFGVWELFSGVLKFIDSKDLKDEGIRGYQVFLYIGILEMLSGVLALVKPIDEYLGVNVVVAMIILIQCFNFAFKVVIYPKILKVTPEEYAAMEKAMDVYAHEMEEYYHHLDEQHDKEHSDTNKICVEEC